MDYLLALDQGTSSSRSILFDRNGQIVGLAQQEFTQHYPQSGWVEHDALEIWRTQLVTMQKVLHQSAVDIARVRAVGITNQRETSVLWDRATGQPLGPAIVWQDRRGEPLCRQLRDQGHEPMILEKTGLRLDAYFSATKLAWMLEHLPQARARADKGELLFGTIDSWLIWQLTGGKVHATDVTNASRTMLFNVHTGQWDSQLLDLFQIPPSLLPQVMPSSAHYGDIPADLLGYALPICGVAGDQHSALFGQACTRAGMAKNTYGTGCFACCTPARALPLLKMDCLRLGLRNMASNSRSSRWKAAFLWPARPCSGCVTGLGLLKEAGMCRRWPSRYPIREALCSSLPLPAWVRHIGRPTPAERWSASIAPRLLRTSPVLRSRALPIRVPHCCRPWRVTAWGWSNYGWMAAPASTMR